MKKTLSSICFLLALSYYSYTQDLPTKASVLKILGDINRKNIENGNDQFGVDTDKPFKFIDSKFTTLLSDECTVIVPVLFGYNPRDLVIHFSRVNSKSAWNKDYIHLTENVSYSAESADTIDINPNDKLKELSYSFGTMRRGYKNESFKIISLRTGKEKVLYSNESFLYPGEDEFASGLVVGDSVYVLNITELKDLDNDGIKEISETKRIGLLLNKVQVIGESYWDMKIEEETFLTVYTFKNGFFLKANPKLVSSKTDDYNNLIKEKGIEE